MRCRVCNLGPMEGVTVYRENPPGEMPAVWACKEHRTVPVDPEDQRLIDVLEGLDPEDTTI